MKRISGTLLIALILALFMTATYGKNAQLRSDPDLVYVRVTAIERERGRPIKGLLKEQLKISEDNVPQNIVHFSEDNLPLHVGILLDASGDTKDNLKARVLPTFTRSGAKDDEFFIVESGKTPLNDAVLQTIDTLAKRGSNRKIALVLFTTRDLGAYPFMKVRDRLKELDIQLYVIGLQTSSDISTDSARQEWRDLAERTGGSAFFPAAIYEQADICRKIMGLLKSQYMIGYRSTNTATDGKWRKIKITGAQTKKVKVDVVAKPGYYAPTATNTNGTPSSDD